MTPTQLKALEIHRIDFLIRAEQGDAVAAKRLAEVEGMLSNLAECEHCSSKVEESVRWCSQECEDLVAYADAEYRADLMHDMMKEGDA